MPTSMQDGTCVTLEGATADASVPVATGDVETLAVESVAEAGPDSVRSGVSGQEAAELGQSRKGYLASTSQEAHSSESSSEGGRSSSEAELEGSLSAYDGRVVEGLVADDSTDFGDERPLGDSESRGGVDFVDDNSRDAQKIVAEVGTEKIAITVQREDWETLEGMGFRYLSTGTVVAMAYRRQAPSLYSSRYSRVVLLDRYGLELGADWEPQTWAQFVSFVESGGSCRVMGRMRGGMDPAQQDVLDQAVFDDAMPWDTLDHLMFMIRSGNARPADADPQLLSLAAALASVPQLQQWSPLESLPAEMIEGCV